MQWSLDPLNVVLATERDGSVEPSLGAGSASRVKSESSTEFMVFLVDDDHAILESLTRLLRTPGYRIKAYSSSETFLAEHDTSVPGCVVLDMAMPVLNGLDVQRVLKRQDSERPVIFLTGHANIHSTVLAMRAGATDVLVKPVNASTLLHAIKSAEEQDRINRCAERERRATLALLEKLSPREKRGPHARRVAALVEAVAEAEEGLAAAEAVGQGALDVAGAAQLVEHRLDARGETAVLRALDGREAGHDDGVGIRAGRGDAAGGEGRDVQLVIGAEDQRGADQVRRMASPIASGIDREARWRPLRRAPIRRTSWPSGHPLTAIADAGPGVAGHWRD